MTGTATTFKIGKSVVRVRHRRSFFLTNPTQTHSSSGAWSKEEEEELTRIVTEMTVEQGKDIDNDIFWGVVSKRMGGKRGRQQCRIKWSVPLPCCARLSNSLNGVSGRTH